MSSVDTPSQLSKASTIAATPMPPAVVVPTRQQQPQTYHHEALTFSFIKLWRRTLRTMLRSASYAFIARLLFGVMKSVLRHGMKLGKLLPAVGREVTDGDPMKWALLVGSLSSYRGVRVTLEKWLPIPPWLAAVVAGATSTLGTFAMNLQTRTELALYLLIRAAHGLLCTYVHPRLPSVMQQFTHWDVVAMTLSASQILWGAFFSPDCHSAKYQDFLVRCTMFDPRVVNGVGGLYKGQITPAAVDFLWERKLPLPRSPTDVEHGCVLLHPGKTCNEALLHFLKDHFLRFSLPLYVPLKIVTTTLFGMKKLIKQPLPTLGKMVTQSVTSSMFLTLYCAGPCRVICAFNQFHIVSPRGIGLFAGLLAGPATLLEPKNRRMDLALFCSMHALRNAYLSLVNRTIMPRPNRHWLTVMLAASTAALFALYDYHPEVTHPNVRGTLSWLLSEGHALHHAHLTGNKQSSQPSQAHRHLTGATIQIGPQ